MSRARTERVDDHAEGVGDAARGIDPSAKHGELGAELAEAIHDRRTLRHPRRLAAIARGSHAGEVRQRALSSRETSAKAAAEADEAVGTHRHVLAEDPELNSRVDEGRLTLAAVGRWIVMAVVLVAEVPLSQSVFEALGVAPTSTIVMVVAIELAILAISHHIGRQRSFGSSRGLVVVAGAVVVATILLVGAFRGVGLDQAQITLAGGDPATAPQLSTGTAMLLFALIQFLFAMAAVILGGQGAQSARLRPHQAATRRRRLARHRVGRVDLQLQWNAASEHRARARVMRMQAADEAAEAAMTSRANRRWASYRRGALSEDPTLDFAFHRLGPVLAPTAALAHPSARPSERGPSPATLAETAKVQA